MSRVPQAMDLLKSPINFPEAYSGKFAIKNDVKKAGTEFDVVSARQAFLTGTPRLKLVTDHEVTIHKLVEGTGTLMSDTPIELAMMKEFVKEAQGHVLIGGLGLSLVTRLVALVPKVKSVTTVEIEQDVINLTGHDLPSNVTVIKADLFEYLRELKSWSYQRAFMDIWYPTSEGTWVDFVAPLRRIIANRFGTRRNVQYWGEPEMQGQMVRSLSHQSTLPLEEVKFSPAHYTFRAATLWKYPANPKWNSESPEEQMNGILAREKLFATDAYFRHMVQVFLLKIGSKAWEHIFGEYWDKWKEKKR